MPIIFPKAEQEMFENISKHQDFIILNKKNQIKELFFLLHISSQ